MANIREAVDKFTKAFNAHDLDALDRLAAPNATLEAPGKQKFQGLAELRRWNQSWMTAFPDCQVTVRNVVIEGNTSVAECIFEGTQTGTLTSPMGDVPPTGRKLSGEYVDVANYDDEGLVRSAKIYFDVADLMTQLGLMPAPAGATA